MYPPKDARELGILLRISRDLDVVGDVTATVDDPSELVAWAVILTDPAVMAWRAAHSGHRYLQVSAHRNRAPVRGSISAVLPCDPHQQFWQALNLDQLAVSDRRTLTPDALSAAWNVMPITPAALGDLTTDPAEPAN